MAMTYIPLDQCHKIFRRRICQRHFGGQHRGPGTVQCSLCHKFPECKKMARETPAYVGLSQEDMLEKNAA